MDRYRHVAGQFVCVARVAQQNRQQRHRQEILKVLIIVTPIQLINADRAMTRGWIYCRDDLEGCVNLIWSGDDHQRWMMNEVNKLIWYVKVRSSNR